MTDDIIHFEQLWQKAEEASKTQYRTNSKEELLNDVLNLLGQYKTLQTSTAPLEFKQQLQTGMLGEVLFLIAALSQRDEIDVYAALKGELDDIG